MSIIDFIKGLIGKVSEQFTETPETTPEVTKLSEKRKERQEEREDEDEPLYNYSEMVTIGEKMYKLSKDDELLVSNDGGKKWEFVTDIPLTDVYGLTVADDGELAIIGQYKDSSIKTELKVMWAEIVESFKGESGEEDIADLKLGWEMSERAFKIKGRRLMVASEKGKLGYFTSVPFANYTMTLWKGAFKNDETMKKEVKAFGMENDETVDFNLIYYPELKEVFYTFDRKYLRRLSGKLPKNIMAFEMYENILVAKDKEFNKYFYFDGEWKRIDFEADYEVDEDMPLYNRIKGDVTTYHYGVPNDMLVLDGGIAMLTETENEITWKTKSVHLFFQNGAMGLLKDGPETYYLANNHVRDEEFQNELDMKVITSVTELFGEVVVQGEVKKDKVIKQIFYQDEWRQCGGEGQSDALPTDCVGPFCFEAYIYEDDPYWDSVSSPVEEFYIDLKKKKEKFLARKIVLKVPKCNPHNFIYFGKDNEWHFHSSPNNNTFLRGSVFFEYLGSSGKPGSIENIKTKEVQGHTPQSLHFYDFHGNRYVWKKKKGILTKGSYKWVKD